MALLDAGKCSCLPKTLHGSFSFLPGGNVMHAAGKVLTLVSPSGAIVFERTAESAGVDGFSSIAVTVCIVLGNFQHANLGWYPTSVENVLLRYNAESGEVISTIAFS